MAGPARLTPTGLQPGSAETFSTYVRGLPPAKTPLTGSELVPIIQNTFPVAAPPNIVGFGPPVRTILTANTNYYVTVTGSDSANGSLATPWATIQRACNFIVENLDLAGFVATINVGVGSFAGANPIGTPVAPGTIFIKGAGSASTTITSNFQSGNNLAIDKVTMAGASLQDLSVCTLGDIGFGSGDVAFTVGNPGAAAILIENYQIFFVALGNFKLSGTWLNQYNLAAGGQVQDFGSWTFTGTPTFNDAVINLSTNSAMFSGTYSGAATGAQYKITASSALVTGGNPIPGNAALNMVDSTSAIDGKLGSSLAYPRVSTTIRTVLTANTSFYVATTGSDSNPGTLASPWATLQHAWNFVSGSIDGGSFNVIINVGAGTFATFNAASGCLGIGQVKILGASSATTTLQNASFTAAQLNCVVPIDQVTLKDAGTGFGNGTCLYTQSIGQLVLGTLTGDIAFVSGGSLVTFAYVYAFGIGTDVFIGASLTASGSSNTAGLWADTQSQISYGNGGGEVFTVSGTPSFGVAFAVTDGFGLIELITSSFTGAATGPRFNATNGGGIIAFSGNALTTTTFPGNADGFVDASSIYGNAFGALTASGLPTTTQFPSHGTGGLYKDTSGGGVYMVYNDAGTIKKVALT